MADTFDLPGFAAFLEGKAAGLPAAGHEGLEKGCQIIEAEAKRVIGTYDYNWKPLAYVTLHGGWVAPGVWIPGKIAQGYASPGQDNPLLATGEMRASIEHTVGNDEAQVGSNNDKAVWQELGTSRGIPPRSFLGDAAVHKAPEVVQAVGQSVVAHVAGRKVI